MYQIRYQNGYEIQVSRTACRVSDRHSQIVYEGTYEECERWLADRGEGRAGN